MLQTKYSSLSSNSFFNVLFISAQVLEITSNVVSKCIPHTRFEIFVVSAQGQGVLSDKLRSFSMQDLTLINADDDLALHTSDPRMRRDPMDDVSSGASTLPRARSSAARQSKATAHSHTHAAASHTWKHTVAQRLQSVLPLGPSFIREHKWRGAGQGQVEPCDLKPCRMAGGGKEVWSRG